MEIVRTFTDEVSGETVSIIRLDSGAEIKANSAMVEGVEFVSKMMSIIERNVELYTSEYEAIEKDMLEYAFKNIVK